MLIDIVKLDKSLIWPCFEDSPIKKPVDQQAVILLEKVISMLLDLGVHIVAEGVETKEMVDRLTALGVHYLQGFYFSRPISEKDYMDFLSLHGLDSQSI